MSSAEQFFYDHAGYSYDPATETPDEGRRRTAADLARAEAWAKAQGHTYEWGPDWQVDHVREYPDAYDAEPDTCEYVTLSDLLDGNVLAALGCVDDATPEYRRVVEAELAWEAMQLPPVAPNTDPGGPCRCPCCGQGVRQ